MKFVMTLVGAIFTLVGAVFTAVCLFLLLPNRLGAFLTGTFGGLGVVFLVLGLCFLVVPRRRQKTIARLLEQGTPVSARIEEVEVDRRFSMNYRHPFRIRCAWQDTASGRTHTFYSESVWYDPSPYLAGRQTLTVYLDPNDPRRYVVDTAGVLPQPEDKR